MVSTVFSTKKLPFAILSVIKSKAEISFFVSRSTVVKIQNSLTSYKGREF